MNIDRINSMLLLEVIDEDRESHWGFLESRLFNLAFWRGDIDGADPESVEVDSDGAEFGTISTRIPLDPGVHVAWWVGWEYSETDADCPDQRSALYFFDVQGR